MFLFLLLAFMVVWALSLVGCTQRAWTQDCEGRAENFGPYATAAFANWITFQSRVVAMAKTAGYCAGESGGAQTAPGLGHEAWPLDEQESNARLTRLSDLTSWSTQLRQAEAWLLWLSPQHIDQLSAQAHGRGKQCGEVGSWLLSPAR